MEEDFDGNSCADGESHRCRDGNLTPADSETVWSIGESCRAKWSGDDKYYVGVIRKLRRHHHGRVSALIRFSDYDSDECEEVDVQQLLKVPRLADKRLLTEGSGSDAVGQNDGGSESFGLFKPFTGSEESSRLERKYGHESESEEESSDVPWISPSYQTKGKVSDWKIHSPAKSQTPNAQRRKGAVASGGSPRKKARTNKKSSPQNAGTDAEKASRAAVASGSAKDHDKLPRNINAQISEASREKPSVRNAIRDASVLATNEETDREFPRQRSDSAERLQRSERSRVPSNVNVTNTKDGHVSGRQECNDLFGGFDEDDLEKPKFSFAAPCAKVPFSLDKDNNVQIPATLNQYLRDYQREGIQFLYSHYVEGRGAILGDDMGLGKTVQVIGFLSALLGKEGNRVDVMRQKPRFIRMMSDTPDLQDSRKCLPFLIIGPGSVLHNWLEEFETWGYFSVRKYHGADKAACLADVAKGKVEVVVTTFETFRDNADALNAVDWEGIIVDEVHRIKGMKAQTTRVLRSVPCLCRYGLTGTALQNNMSELWCILDWAQPEVLGSQEDFEEDFVKPIERGQKHDATKRELAEARRKKEAFARVRSQMMLRRTKKIIADQLPKKTDRVVFCRLTPLQVSVYKAVLSHPDMMSVLKMGSPCPCGSGAARGKCCHQKTPSGKKLWSVMFSFMHVLLKTANHVALLIPHARTSPEQKKHTQQLCEIAFKDHPEFITQTQEAAFRTLSDPEYCGKMKVLQGMLSVFAKSHSKVLVFSYSTRLLDILEQHVISVGHEYRRIDGKVTGMKRQKIVREFNSDPSIFLCLVSTKAGGLGLNMTGANKVVIFDPNWNPSHDLQAQDRAYRIGQRRDVEVFRLISAGTIEENIYLRQIYKQQLDNVAVGTENARRYFHGIQGDSSNQGELFGIKNMFQLRTGNSCLTMDILHRNAKVEAGVAGHDMADYIPSTHEQELEKGDKSFDDDPDSPVDDEYSDDEAFMGLRDLFDAESEIKDAVSPKSPKKKMRELPEDPLPSTSRTSNTRRTNRRHHENSGLDSSLAEEPSIQRGGLRTEKSPRTDVKNVTGENSKNRAERKSPQERGGRSGEKEGAQHGGSRSSKRAVFDDSMKTPSFSSVTSVFEECGVIHVHDNPEVVGASRVEDHMSRCAMQDVFELKTNTQAPALLCDTLTESSEDEAEKAKASSGKGQARKVPRGRSIKKDHNSSRTVDHGKWHILVGQTPAAIRKKHWNQLKQTQSCQDDITLAQQALTASPEERLAMLREMYKQHHDATVHRILDEVLSIPAEPATVEGDASLASEGKKSSVKQTHSKTSTVSEKSKAGKGRGKGKQTKQTQSKRIPAKRKPQTKGIIFSNVDDAEPSQSPRQQPSHSVSDSDDSSDLEVGAKVSPWKVKSTQHKVITPNKARNRSQHRGDVASVGVKRNCASAKRSVTRPMEESAHSRSLDFSDSDSDTDNRKRPQRREDVEGLLQELGGKPDRTCTTVKLDTSQTNQLVSKGERLSKKSPVEKGAYKGSNYKPDVSLLDDIFFDASAEGTTKRKPPPKSKKKSMATVKITTEKVDVTVAGDLDFSSTAAASDLDSSRGVSSPDPFSDFFNNSTLQDDSVDCFADSSLWKKRKKVQRAPPKKIDRLLQETKDDYQELFESGQLVRRCGDRLGADKAAGNEHQREKSGGNAASWCDPSGSLFS